MCLSRQNQNQQLDNVQANLHQSFIYNKGNKTGCSEVQTAPDLGVTSYNESSINQLTKVKGLAFLGSVSMPGLLLEN